MGPNEKPLHEIGPSRRKLWLGMLAWMVFALAGGFLFEHTPVMKFVTIILVGGWCVLAFFSVRYMIHFIWGKRR